jgi:hypothetical protein
MAILFDTLKIRNRLTQKGMDEAVAEELAELLNEAQIADLATRRDLDPLATKADVAQLETRLMRWTIAAAGIGGLVGGLIGSLAK